MSVFVKSGGGENVTPEVQAQTPLVTEILESLVGKVTLANATPEAILEGYSAYVGQELVRGTNKGVVECGTFVSSSDAIAVTIDSKLNNFDTIEITADVMTYPTFGFYLARCFYEKETLMVSTHEHKGAALYTTNNSSSMYYSFNPIITHTANRLSIEINNGGTYKFKGGVEYKYTITKRT